MKITWWDGGNDIALMFNGVRNDNQKIKVLNLTITRNKWKKILLI